MARKTERKYFQADISTDAELRRFVKHRGLLVLEIYSEWCGPFIDVLNSLWKIKKEIGKMLNLAICKADTITPFERFVNRSEVTWLFVVNGKAINVMFGTNIPRLIRVIRQELKLMTPECTRHVYELGEPLPEEVERNRKRDLATSEAAQKQIGNTTKKKTDHLNYVTDTIMENLPNVGVIMFGPQVHRTMFKTILEVAKPFNIQCQDRRVGIVSKDEFEAFNYACTNPLDPEIIEQLHNKELMMCYWKLPDDNNQSVSEGLDMLAHEFTKTETTEDDDGVEHTSQPLISPKTIKYKVTLQDGEKWAAKDGTEIVRPRKPQRKTMMDGDRNRGKYEGRTRMKSVTFPAVWVASNTRTHAALVYIYFRVQTKLFLEPDPVSDPPHVIMAFDAYKHPELISMSEDHIKTREDVLLYGFFTSDDVEEAEYISSSAQVYLSKPRVHTDKIIFKVAKTTSDTMLRMAGCRPSYVSANTTIGMEEALKFFPANFKSAADEKAEANLLDLEKK